jgi:hypothetical protein
VGGSGAEDPVERIRLAARRAIAIRPVADFLAMECAVMYYALGSWRARPHVPEGSIGLGYEKSSALAQYLPMLGFLVLTALDL